jgi:hypothetical protein
MPTTESMVYARVEDGLDTNDNVADFELTGPTPGGAR